jgi:purine-binding chemotaxis protein CheW
MEDFNLSSFENEDTQKDRFLTFRVDKDIFGLEIKYVTEIVGIQEITVMPDFPEYVKGIINLRGNIILVIDVRLRFKKEPIDYNDRTCVVVVDIKEASIGLIVDSVSDVITILEKDITNPPQLFNSNCTKYLKKIGKIGSNVILLLDCEYLLSEEEFENISNFL